MIQIMLIYLLLIYHLSYWMTVVLCLSALTVPHVT